MPAFSFESNRREAGFSFLGGNMSWKSISDEAGSRIVKDSDLHDEDRKRVISMFRGREWGSTEAVEEIAVELQLSVDDVKSALGENFGFKR
jgi:hypothetical protein